MAYLANIFDYLNSVNAGVQGSNENILTSTDKLLKSIYIFLENVNNSKKHGKRVSCSSK